jgi:hypothetical protein
LLALFQSAQHISEKKEGSGSGSAPLTNGSGSGSGRPKKKKKTCGSRSPTLATRIIKEVHAILMYLDLAPPPCWLIEAEPLTAIQREEIPKGKEMGGRN